MEPANVEQNKPEASAEDKTYTKVCNIQCLDAYVYTRIR